MLLDSQPGEITGISLAYRLSPESCQSNQLCLDELHILCDRYFVSRQHATELQRRIPRMPKVSTIDFRCPGKADALVPPRIFGRRAYIVHTQDDGFGNALYRQIAGNL